MSERLVGRMHHTAIRANRSLLPVGILLALTVGSWALRDTPGDHPQVEVLVAGFAVLGGCVAALIVHELAHALMARRCDIRVTSITLWPFGGITRPWSPHAPGAVPVALAGPVTSIGIGLIAVGSGLALGGLGGASLVWVGVVSMLLGGLNLLPGLPLDGGRIYEAWLCRRRGLSPDAAAERAARLGRRIGEAMLWVGMARIVVHEAVGRHSVLGGLWMLIIGWFVREAAGQTGVMNRPDRLRRLHVHDVMTARPDTVAPDMSVADFIDQVLIDGRHVAYPVVTADGTVTGLLRVARVMAVEPQRYRRTSVADVADPLKELAVVAPDDSADHLVDLIGLRADHRALVIDNGRLIGIVSPSDMARLLTRIEIDGLLDLSSRS